RIGELRGLEALLEARKALAAAMQERTRRMGEAIAANGQALAGVRHLAVQHPQRQPRAGSGEAAEMRVRVGAQAARQRAACGIEALARDGEQFACGGKRA